MMPHISIHENGLILNKLTKHYLKLQVQGNNMELELSRNLNTVPRVCKYRWLGLIVLSE